MLDKLSGQGARTHLVVPINVPARSELWHRQQLAKSLLSHRPYSPETAQLVLDILNGDDAADGSVTSGS